MLLDRFDQVITISTQRELDAIPDEEFITRLTTAKIASTSYRQPIPTMARPQWTFTRRFSSLKRPKVVDVPWVSQRVEQCVGGAELRSRGEVCPRYSYR